jgi:hypothetical protein
MRQVARTTTQTTAARQTRVAIDFSGNFHNGETGDDQTSNAK